MERKVRDSCGKSESRGDPAGESRGGSPTARGKRVPGVEINVQIVQAIKIDKLDFHRVCLQFEKVPYKGTFFFRLKFIEPALDLVLFSISMQDEAGDKAYSAYRNEQSY